MAYHGNIRQWILHKLIENTLDHRLIHLALTPDERTKVFATGPKLLHMFTGRLPIGTIHDLSQLLMRKQMTTIPTPPKRPKQHDHGLPVGCRIWKGCVYALPLNTKPLIFSIYIHCRKLLSGGCS
ncbi:MAG: hypothetical protein H8D34_30725 [Chloroflexi bacterium]|nr:hypothetical protein [Chloroflexota bacterium]